MNCAPATCKLKQERRNPRTEQLFASRVFRFSVSLCFALLCSSSLFLSFCLFKEAVPSPSPSQSLIESRIGFEKLKTDQTVPDTNNAAGQKAKTLINSEKSFYLKKRPSLPLDDNVWRLSTLVSVAVTGTGSASHVDAFLGNARLKVQNRHSKRPSGQTKISTKIKLVFFTPSAFFIYQNCLFY